MLGTSGDPDRAFAARIAVGLDRWLHGPAVFVLRDCFCNRLIPDLFSQEQVRGRVWIENFAPAMNLWVVRTDGRRIVKLPFFEMWHIEEEFSSASLTVTVVTLSDRVLVHETM